MASVRQIARRIRSFENTAKITKAMSMIAASKLRRTQDAATQGRSYADSMSEMVSNVMSQARDDELSQPLAEPREVTNVGLVLITPDRGLTGGLNSNVLRAVGDFVGLQSVPVKVVALGKKGIDFARRSGLELIGELSGISDRPTSSDTSPISKAIIDGFINGQVDSIHVAYAQFVNTTMQRPTVIQLAPVVTPEISNVDNHCLLYTSPSPRD
mgnify:CR=1 FL=1